MVRPIKLFEPEEVCPISGVYKAVHDPDCRGYEEVAVQKGKPFPICLSCKDSVRYAILRAAAFPSEDPDFS
jgi:hypothetical protein